LAVTGDDAEILELAEARREHGSADSRHSGHERVEPERFVQHQLSDDHEAPSVTQVLDRFRE
jgi:hypothetical protein